LPGTDGRRVGDAGDGLVLDRLLQGAESILAHRHRLSLPVDGDGQGSDVRVLARELQDLLARLGESSVAGRGGLDVPASALEERRKRLETLADLPVLSGHRGLEV